MDFSEALKHRWKPEIFPDGVNIVTDNAEKELVLGSAVCHTKELAKYMCELHNYRIEPILF